jgi:hypothetical protein
MSAFSYFLIAWGTFWVFAFVLVLKDIFKRKEK